MVWKIGLDLIPRHRPYSMEPYHKSITVITHTANKQLKVILIRQLFKLFRISSGIKNSHNLNNISIKAVDDLVIFFN